MKTVNAEFFKPLHEYLKKHGEFVYIDNDTFVLTKKFNAGCHPNIDRDFELDMYIGNSGEICKIVEKVNGEKHGLYFEFYYNGKLRTITNYLKGELEGCYCRFDKLKNRDIDDANWLLTRSTWENGERTEYQHNREGWVKDLNDLIYICILDDASASRGMLGFIKSDGTLDLDDADDALEKKYIADITIDTETTIQELSNVYYIRNTVDQACSVKTLDYGAVVENPYNKVKKDFINHGAYCHVPYAKSGPSVYGTWNNGKRCGVWAYINNDAECTLNKLCFYDKEGNLACEIKNIETGGRDKSKIIRVNDYTLSGRPTKWDTFTISRALVLGYTGSTESWLFGDDPEDYIPGRNGEFSEDLQYTTDAPTVKVLENRLSNLKTKPDELPEPPKEIKVEFPESKDESDDDMLLIL